MLQQEIADVLEKGPASRADLASFEPARRDARPSNAAPSGPHFPSLSQRAADLAAGASEFGTLVPQRESAPRTEPTARAGEAAPASETPTVVALPSRPLSSSTVAPFTRPTRETAKSPEPVAPAEEPKVTAAQDAGTPAASHNAAQEALLDAVVDMVQKQPESLSVFTSGASFISGVVGKVQAAEVSKAVDAATGAPGAAPKMDKAAAELLRPMLRQWLSDNMPRIVEEALRSELMSAGDGKGSKG
jgi:cell pole-organizing protein PopZ